MSDQQRLIDNLSQEERQRLALLSVLEDERQARQALQASEELWRTLVSTSPDFIALHDREARFIYLNRYAEGFVEQDVVGKSLYDFVSDESRESYRRTFAACLETQKMQQFEYTAKGDRGMQRSYESYLVPIIEHGHVAKVMAIARDISERKKSEAKEKHNAEQMALLADSAFTIATAQDESQIYRMIADKITQLVPGAVVTISSRDDNDSQGLAALAGLGKKLQKVTEIIGFDPTRIRQPLSDISAEERQSYMNGKLNQYHGGLYQLTSGRLPKTVCAGLEKLLGIAQIHMIGFTWGGEFHGMVALFLPRHAVIADPAIIETLINHAATALRRKRAERSLAESEERFRSVFENTFIGIYRTAPDGRILLANPALVNMLGYKNAEELIKRNLETGGYAAGYTRGEFKRLMETAGVMLGHEAQWKRIDGSTIWVRESARAIRDSSGQIAYYEGTVEDITSRKTAELALQESETRFRQLAENIEQVYWLTDWENKKLLYVNPSFEKMFGRTCQSAYENRMNWTEAIHPDDREWVSRQFLEKAQQGLPAEAEYRIIRSDGAMRWVYDRSVPIRDQQGSVYLIASVAEDITGRKQAELTLRESERKYRLMVESINDVIFSIDTTGILTYISPAIERVMQYKTAEIIGQPFARFIHPDDLMALQASFLRNLEGIDEPASFRIIDKDGSVKHVRSVSHRVMESGKVPGITGTLTDCTQQHRMELEKAQMEDELRQAQKMEAIGQLAGGVAHDFNNMLTGIMGNAEMLLMKLSNEPALSELAERIVKTAENAARLTRQLLSFARKGQYEQTPVDIHKTIAEVAGMLGNTIDRRIKIRQRLLASPATVLGDTGQLENALLNLGLNARDAMPHGGELIFSTQIAEIDDEYMKLHGYKMPPGKYVQVTVTDTGTGMPPEVRAHVFEPFFTTKEQGKGTGLGLASVYGIVKGHNGAIEVYSELGHGTAIKIFLPLLQGEPETSVVASPRPAALTPGHGSILLIDDEKMIREIASQMLQSLGYSVKICADGREAVDYYRANHGAIDLVILDMIMPQLNGREAFLEMRKINPGIRALLSSGFSVDGEAQEVMKLGIKGFVQKPYRMKEMADKISEVLGNA